MLLNASHQITHCGLPDHVQNRYIRYKQGNRAIVAWMTKHGPEKFKGRRTLPIKQLVELGKTLCTKVQEIGSLPADVDYYFQEVIKERGYLSQHFRMHRDQCEKDDIDTVNHEHFTQSLKEIHQTLLTAGKRNLIPKSQARDQFHARSASSANTSIEVKNAFDHLLLDNADIQVPDESDEEISTDSDTDTDTDVTSNCSHSCSLSDACTHDDRDNGTDFLDSEGEVGEAIESVMFLNEIGKIANSIKICWIKAGRNEEPLAASTVKTNVLIRRAMLHVRSFQDIERDQPEFSKVRRQFRRLLSQQYGDEDLESDHTYGTLRELDRVFLTFEDMFIDEANLPHPKVSVLQATTGPLPTSKDALIQNLFFDVRSAMDSQDNSSITFQGLQILDELGALRNDILPDKALEFCTCIYLIAVGHYAYSSTLDQPNRMAMARVSALRIAKEAATSIGEFAYNKAIFPCHCTNTLGYRMIQVYNDLENFTKYRCWSVLMQSPFVAGNHILEVLDICAYYGMHLFHYRQYAAAVLHTYQALIQLNAVERIPILEEVCQTFAPVLYTTGKRPESGFVACWLRYSGARLKFRKGKRYHDHKDTWCMSVPARAAAYSAGLNIGTRDNEVKIENKFDYGLLDNTIRLKREGYRLQEDALKVLDQDLNERHGHNIVVTKKSKASCLQRSETAQEPRNRRHKRTKSCYVDDDDEALGKTDSCFNLAHIINDAFGTYASQGRKLPTSKINLLSLFHSMTKVVSGISDATHARDGDHHSITNKDEGKGQMCLCFVQTILRAADRIQDVRKRNGVDANGAVWSKNERECIESYKEHLTKMLRDAKVDEGSGGNWLWQCM